MSCHELPKCWYFVTFQSTVLVLEFKIHNIDFWHSLKQWGYHYAQDSKSFSYTGSPCAATETPWNVSGLALCAPKGKFVEEGVTSDAGTLRLSSPHCFKMLYGSSSS